MAKCERLLNLGGRGGTRGDCNILFLVLCV